MTIIVKDQALRALVREALDSQIPSQSPGPDDVVKINHVVDPQAPEIDPDDQDFHPQNAIELKAASRYMFDALPSESIPIVYDKMKVVINNNHTSSYDDKRRRAQVKGEGKFTMRSNVEETIRKAIRLQLAEQMNATNIDEAEDETDAPKKRRGAYKDTALGQMGDDGTNFAKIATDLGFSVSGAKQAVDKALRKTQFLQTKIDPDDLEILILTAMKDYIDHLASASVQKPSKRAEVDQATWDKEMARYREKMAELGIDPEGDMGDITSDDIELMKKHPNIVRTLPGFRDFLHKYIRDAAAEMDEKIS